MNSQTLLMYSFASLLLAITPGPTMLLTLSNGINAGRRAAIAGMLGASTGSSALIAIAAAGLGTILQASQSLFEAVRWAGVVYLCWIGWKLWWSSPAESSLSGYTARESISARTAYVRSLSVALSNPKTILFFAAFLPQFVDPAQPQAHQYFVLGLVFVAIDSMVMVAYALAGEQAGRLLSASATRALNRCCAAGMWLLAASLAIWRR